MNKRTPVYLLNRYCNFHTCHNSHCQLPEVASVFFPPFINLFFCRESLFGHAMRKRRYISPFIFDELRVFYGESLGLLSWAVLVLFCQWVLWCQFIQVSSTCRLFFWSSVIFIQPLEPSTNHRSGNLITIMIKKWQYTMYFVLEIEWPSNLWCKLC